MKKRRNVLLGLVVLVFLSFIGDRCLNGPREGIMNFKLWQTEEAQNEQPKEAKKPYSLELHGQHDSAFIAFHGRHKRVPDRYWLDGTETREAFKAKLDSVRDRVKPLADEAGISIHVSVYRPIDPPPEALFRQPKRGKAVFLHLIPKSYAEDKGVEKIPLFHFHRRGSGVVLLRAIEMPKILEDPLLRYLIRRASADIDHPWVEETKPDDQYIDEEVSASTHLIVWLDKAVGGYRYSDLVVNWMERAVEAGNYLEPQRSLDMDDVTRIGNMFDMQEASFNVHWFVNQVLFDSYWLYYVDGVWIQLEKEERIPIHRQTYRARNGFGGDIPEVPEGRLDHPNK